MDPSRAWQRSTDSPPGAEDRRGAGRRGGGDRPRTDAHGAYLARALGEGALAIAAGDERPDPEPEIAQPLVDDGTCPPEWTAYPGCYRAHNPWLPTFLIAARDDRLTMGTDWLDGSERLALAHVEADGLRAGEAEWSPERLRFDTVIHGRAQRAVHSGTPCYRAFTA